MPIVKDGAMRRRCKALYGTRYAKSTRINFSFDVFTPRDYNDPATDEVLLLDFLDEMFRYLREFHDIPGVKLVRYTANGRDIL